MRPTLDSNEESELSRPSIDSILRSEIPRGLPIGFAERMADLAMSAPARDRLSIWDLLLQLSPRVGIAAGVIATLLLVFALTGEGPTMFEAMGDYATVETIISIP